MAASATYRTRRVTRLVAFAVGSLATVAMIALLALEVLDAMAITSERETSSYADVEMVDLHSGRGEIEIVPATGDRVLVTVDARSGPFSDPAREAELRAGELRLDGGCRVLMLGTCHEHWRIAVPKGTAVRVRNDAGETSARGLRGDVDIESAAGSLRAVDVRGDTIRLHSAAGALRVERSVARRVEASTAAGSVSVSLLRPPREVDASSAAGEVVVRLPDAAYDVDADTAAGEEHVTVRNRPGSPRKIRAHSSAGVVRVLRLGTVRAGGAKPDR